MKKPLKMLLYLLVLIISPMILAALASAAFLTIHLAIGESFSEAMLALTMLYHQVLPFMPYITGIPLVLVVVAFIIRRKLST